MSAALHSDSTPPIGKRRRPAATAGGLPAMAVFLWALPQFAVPAGAAYRPPAASLFLVLWALAALLRPGSIQVRQADPGELRQWVLVFFTYCVVSAFYGYSNLDSVARLTLKLTTGNVEYI